MKKSDLSILIVEDDVNFCRTMTEAVKSFGFRPLAVSKVEEAIQLSKIKSIHAAVIDCVLPKMNGVELSQEIRKTRFGNAPIFLMSGILTDRAFIQEAKDLSKATEYLTKPFDLNEFKTALEKSLSHLLEEKTVVDLKAIVAKNFQTVRQRIKMIEALETIKGWDLLLVLGILAEAKVSGQLNLVNEAGDIAGITLSHGVIVKVDVANAKESIKKMLSEQNLIDDDDEITLNQILDTGKNFVDEAITHSLISPHIAAELGNRIIHVELEQLFLEKSFQISYAPSEHADAEPMESWDQQSNYFNQVLFRRLPMTYLSEFYEAWDHFPIRMDSNFNENDVIFQNPNFKDVKDWKNVFSNGPTIDELTTFLKIEKDKVYRLIHCLVVKRHIIFDDFQKVKSREELENKVQTLFANTVGKTPMQIFNYFGVDDQMRIEHLSKVFHDFSRSNHPDQLPKECSEAIKSKMNQIFASVSEAYNTLSDPQKRDFYFKNIKAKEAAKQMNAENMVQEGMQLIRKGQYFLALGKLKEAQNLYPSNDTLMQIIFCELKSAPTPLPLAVKSAVQAKMDMLRPDDKKKVLFFLNSALLAKASNEMQTALEFLQKAISMDPNLLEARREITAIQSNIKQKKDGDILTGDLSVVFSRFFKKKSS